MIKTLKNQLKINKRNDISSQYFSNDNYIISIYSLNKDIGCTGLVRFIACFIKYVLNRTVCIVNITKSDCEETIDGIPVFYVDRYYEICHKFNFVILDMGFNDVSINTLFNPNVNIMTAVMDLDYIKKLAEFIEAEENSLGWKYIFINIPAKKRKYINDLMEDYQHWCLPDDERNILTKKNVKLITRLVTGGKI